MWGTKGPFPEKKKKARSVRLTIHFHIVYRVRMCDGATPLFLPRTKFIA